MFDNTNQQTTTDLYIKIKRKVYEREYVFLDQINFYGDTIGGNDIYYIDDSIYILTGILKTLSQYFTILT